jgi:KipI family sensor histidine kinase inhibitor
MRVLPMGIRAVLVDELESEPAAWAAGLRALAVTGVIEIVPAATTVLVTVDDGRTLEGVRRRLAHVRPAPDEVASGDVVEIAVRYDGADLEAVASALGVDEEQVVALHTAPAYRVGFCGFAPGFAYLEGTDPRLHLPRKATPRPTVPAGSVAVAGGYTAVYPRSSPGGWNLLGTTDAIMFDTERDPPALLAPGTHVRLVRR